MSAPSMPWMVRLRVPVLAVFVALSLWLGVRAGEVTRDDDVLSFLPPDDPDVVEFRRLARRFGMLDVALVGLDGGPEGLFDPDAVARIRSLARRIETVEGVRLVLSFADLPHPVVRPDGLEVAALVPEDLRDREAIRARVLESPDAVGNLVSAEGRAAVLMVFLAHVEGARRAEVRDRTLSRIHAMVEEGWTHAAYFGGAPFMEWEASRGSRRDLARLSPGVIGVLGLATAVSLRSVAAALANLALAGIAVVWVLGGHVLAGEPLTIVSNTMPVLMVALGGAFGVHMLAGYRRQRGLPAERAAAAYRELRAPVLLSGLTTAVAFFSLAVLPQAPVRRFGVAAGLGMLLLLAFALLVVPALLALLPRRALPPREASVGRRLLVLPRWALVAAGALAATAWPALRPDPDTSHVFPPESVPRRAAAFLDRHFGGSVYLQVGVEGDLTDPVVLRTIRDLAAEVAAVDGVADVRSLADPVATLNAALGGRRGVPETPGRARRVLSYLADHPAMAQLMTAEKDAALVHVKLAPAEGPRQQEVLAAVERVVRAQAPEGLLFVAPSDVEEAARARRTRIRSLVEREIGRTLADEEAELLYADPPPDPELGALVRAIRDRALDSEDSPVEGVPRAEIERITAADLLGRTEAQVTEVLRRKLPTLAAKDPEGVRFAAEHLVAWLSDARAKWAVAARCRRLGVEPYRPATGSNGSPAGGETSEDRPLSSACARLSGVLAELDEATWALPHPPAQGRVLRKVPVQVGLTGQPVVGRAFARSVLSNLRASTLLSVGVLAGVLFVFGYVRALVPAIWALAVVGAVLLLAGHPIGIGTSMVASIALGAGVDFAIHLLVWARRHGGYGRTAGKALGGVILASGGTLAAAFSVLGAASMLPIRQFGWGLAAALASAAAGAVLWISYLAPGGSGGSGGGPSA